MPLLLISLALVGILLPGFAFCRLLGGHRHVFLVSVASGLSVVIVTQAVARWVTGGWVLWAALLVAFTAGCLIVSALFTRSRVSPVLLPGLDITVGAVLVVVSWSLYWMFVGGYSEVPSDFWNHLERIRLEADWLHKGELGSYGSSLTTWINRDYLHALHALAVVPGGMSILVATEITGFVATLLFLLATYGFALAVLEGPKTSASRTVPMALLSVLFVFLWKGITVFSFVRYYAIAPVMLAFVMYYGFLAVVLGMISGREPVVRSMALLILLAVGMLLAHVQELGLSLLMAAVMIVVAWVVGRAPGAISTGRAFTAVVVAIVVVITLAASVIVHNYDPGSVGSRKLMYLGDHVPFFKDVFILNPGYQFYQVLGGFGILVLGFALLNIRRLVGYPLLLAGALLPFITVFNPVFVYLFLHVAKYETLWRVLFAIPVSFLAAFLLVDLLVRFGKFARLARVFGVLAITTGCLTLLPIQIGDYRNAASRWGSIVDVKAQGVYWVADAVEYLDTLKPGFVYSDPVTSYVVRGATVHDARGWKFYPGRSGYDFSSLAERGQFSGFLESNHGIYLINRRDIPNTRNGADSGHWYVDVLTTSKWYPEGFEEQLVSIGAELLFENGGISIYRHEGTNMALPGTNGDLQTF